MTNSAAPHSALSRLDFKTRMMQAAVDSSSDAELSTPSRCEGWTRAHVVAHPASNGRASVKLVGWAATGEVQRL